MATSNRIRALNRLPFDFEDGLKVGGVDVTNLNQAFTAAGAGLIGFTPVGNLAAGNVQAALAELDNEKVGFARLDDTDGSSLVGYDGGTVQDVMDSAKPMVDYAALRAYTGRATSVRITSKGIAGFFYYDAADTTSVDNGGTVIVAGNGKRWKRIYSEEVNVLWFMSPAQAADVRNGTGSIDVTAAIQAALAFAKSVLFPAGAYKTTGFDISGEKIIVGEGSDVTGTRFVLDASSLDGITVGSVSRFVGKLDSFSVERTSYSGATENSGLLFIDATNSTVSRVTSRRSKYPFNFLPGASQRVAYNTFSNVQAVGGNKNLKIAQGTGFANENLFIGGRMFTTSDTVTNVEITGNHNRFIGVCAEGAGQKAFHVTGTGTHSILIDSPRTEGTWSDGPVVIDSGVQNTTVIANDLYTSTVDNGTGSVIFTRSKSSISGVNTASPTLTLDNSNTATATKLLQLRSRNFGETAVAFEVIRHSDSLNLVSVNGVGRVQARSGFKSENYGWNFYPLQLGEYYLWISNTSPNVGKLMIKNSAPTSDNDGTVVGAQT